jgi:hypothetical protein
MNRILTVVGLAILVGFARPAPASAQQSISFYLGGFVPRGEDARDQNDVLAADHAFLAFDINHLGSGTVGAEWLVALGDKFDAGLGLGFYQHTAPAVDRFNVFDQTGDAIRGDLKLRIIPFTATFRVLPLGHDGPVQPYFGVGAGAFRWRYSETGDFVSTDGSTIVHGSFVGTGGATGPVILGGVRFPVGAGSIGGEVRYQSAVGTLPRGKGFAGGSDTTPPKIDLGGFNYLLTFNIGF